MAEALPDLNPADNLVRVKGTQQIYLREGNILKPIKDSATFAARGYEPGWVQDIDSIDNYTVGAFAANPQTDPAGVLAEQVAHKQIPKLGMADFAWEGTPEEQTAQEAATAEYSPYYQEKLQDYLNQVNTARERALEDKTKNLGALGKERESYLMTEERAWQPQWQKSLGNWVSRGLERSSYMPYQMSQLEEERKQRLNDYERKYGETTGNIEQTYGRSMTDWATQEALQRRENQRALEEAIASGVLQRKTEAQEAYDKAREKYYEGEATPY
jgi:hypothetical protein